MTMLYLLANAQVTCMVNLVISICEILGPLAVVLIGLTLVGIAMGKIRV